MKNIYKIILTVIFSLFINNYLYHNFFVSIINKGISTKNKLPYLIAATVSIIYILISYLVFSVIINGIYIKKTKKIIYGFLMLLVIFILSIFIFEILYAPHWAPVPGPNDTIIPYTQNI